MAKYEYWLTDDGLLLLSAWARDGLTDEDIAAKMGIAIATLYVWKNKYTEVSEALKKGKEVIDIEVENALLKKALDGDVTSMIYWLKNRKPKQWRDKREVEYETTEKTLDSLITIADLIKNPIKNRTIEDIEKGDDD